MQSWNMEYMFTEEHSTHMLCINNTQHVDK